MQKLAGKVIKKVEISEDDMTLVFTTKDGRELVYNAYGDCCSETWFAHITNVKSLLGQLVLDVDNSKHLPTQEQAENEPKQIEMGFDYLQLYGYDLYTKKGVCTIEFRNDSNGYYGGSCDLGTKNPKATYRKITKDF